MTKQGAGTNNNLLAGVALIPARPADHDDGALARTQSSPRASARFDVPEARAWLTAVEASSLKLPSAPSERTIQAAIKSGDIASRRRAGRGGGREFHWTSLLPAAREEYLKRVGVQVIENERADSGKSRAAQRDLKAEARALIVKAADAFITDHQLAVGKGLKSFCAAYQRHRTKLDAWVYGIVPALDVHQVRTWERALRTGGSAALLDKRGRPSGSGTIESDDTLRAYIVSQFAARPQLTAAQLAAAVSTDLQREIPLRTMQAFLAAFRKKHAPTIKALTNPDKHRSHHKPAFGNLSIAIERINQRWEIDATRADAMCLMPDGSRRRCAITGLIDVKTRRAMVLVSDQPRGLATQALLRRAILAWGMPETLKADNGKEFVARAVRRFLDDVGVELQLSRVFTPEQKGHIERFFGTMNRGLFKLLPGFVGHNIAERQAIESRASFAHRFGEVAQLVFETALSPAGLQARVDSWLSDIYEHAAHDGLDGRTPRELALAFADQVRRVSDERALDALLLDAPDASGIRNVGKKGISVAGRWYIAGALGAIMGQRVHVRLDPADLDSIVVYTHDRSAFICIAERDGAISNERRMQIARTAQSVQRRGLRLIRNDVRQVQEQFPAAGLADRLLTNAGGDGFVMQDDAAQAQEIAARPQLVAMKAGLDALEQSKRAAQPVEPTAAERAGAAEYVADLTARLPEKSPMLECDGYSRPNFGDDDIAFWNWCVEFERAGGRLDHGDSELRRDLRESPAFQQLLASKGRA